jgi:hypothetical protein
MPLNNSHLLAIGRIVVAFNILEETTGAASRILMGEGTPPLVSQALTVGESFDRLLFRTKTLAYLRLPYPDFLAELEDWIRAAKKVQEDRNRVLHSGWIWWLEKEQAPDVATALRQSARDVIGQTRDHTPRDLHDIADRITDVKEGLRRLMRRMNSLPMKD